MVIIGLFKRLAKALESLTKSNFIITQKTAAVNALVLPEGLWSGNMFVKPQQNYVLNGLTQMDVLSLFKRCVGYVLGDH